MSDADILIILLLVACLLFLFRRAFMPNKQSKTRYYNSTRERIIVVEPKQQKVSEMRKHKHGAAVSYRTKAFDEGRVLDVIERYRVPVSKPVTDYPVTYTPPEKPVPEKPKITIIVGTPESDSSSLKPYVPNELIVPVIEQTQDDYELPYGAVEMPQAETAVITAIILYFIKKESKIGITKLESYIIMLDKMCFEETGRRLFTYRLTYGPYGYYIQNFRAFLDFIEEKQLLTKRRKYYAKRKYRIDFTAHQEIPEEIFPEQMREWMNRILLVWRGAGADHTKHGMLMMLTHDVIEAFTANPPLIS